MKKSNRLANAEARLDEIRRLKRTRNPATGHEYNYADIGARLGLSAAGVKYQALKLANCCSGCLRPLKVEK